MKRENAIQKIDTILYTGVTLAPCKHFVRAGLFGVTLTLHSYAVLRNGYAAPTIPNAKSFP